MNQTSLNGAIVYHVRPANPGGHLFEVVCRIEAPDPAGQRLSLPAWIPGSYLIRDYARHVVRVEAESRGSAVALRKTDKHTWQAAPVDGELRVRSLVYAADSSVRGAWLDHRSAFFNGVCLFFRVHGQEQKACVVHIDPPDIPGAAPWRLATSLERLTGTRYDFGAFRARNYERLLDHPVLMGELTTAEFDAGGVPHAVVVSGQSQVDLDRLCRDLRRVCSWQQQFFGPPVPVDRYAFLVRAMGDGYGGLEHRHSSALICRRDDLPAPGMQGVPDSYRRFLGLASHEYFHVWHVKRIRPAEFVGADLRAEAYTRQLWIFEGITAYYDDLSLVRSGLITPESYLELVGRSLTRYYRAGGRRQQTLEESSFDTWIKFYRPDENSPNATVSYYLKGSLVALALDLEIRVRTGGARSLDDVMKALWMEFGGDDSPGVPEGAFERLASEVSGLDLEPFFRQTLRSTVDPPFGILLAQVGVRLHLRAAESAGDPGGSPGRREDRPRPWLGMATQSRGGQLRVAVVLDNGPAQAAGLSAGDELVAVNGRRAGPDNFEGELDRLPVDRDAILHVFRDQELLALAARPVPAPKDTAYLTMAGDAPAAALSLRAQWLGQDQS